MKKLLGSNNPEFRSDEGFSLVEVTIALVILLIVLLGVFTVIVYAVNYNAANNARAQALAMLQQEEEILRTAKFTPSFIDANLTGGVKTPKTIVADDGNRFQVEVTVDDDPWTSGVQIDNSGTLKELTLRVTALNPTPGWQTAVPAQVVIRRVRAN